MTQTEPVISADVLHWRESAEIHGLGMRYATAGAGPPIWLLHGKPRACVADDGSF